MQLEPVMQQKSKRTYKKKVYTRKYYSSRKTGRLCFKGSIRM